MSVSLKYRSSSTTAGGTANATSLGGRPSASAPGTGNGTLVSDITKAENDNGTYKYRVIFVYNDGTQDINDVSVSITNGPGGATAQVAKDGTTISSFASYVSPVLSSGTTAPTITGSWGNSVVLGNLAAGQVKHFYLRVRANKAKGMTGDYVKYKTTGNPQE